MISDCITATALLARYWVFCDDNEGISSDTPIDNVTAFAAIHAPNIPQAELDTVTAWLASSLSRGTPSGYITMICFFGHPHFLWNLTLEAMEVARTEAHLELIATNLPEHILAHYGSMISYFEGRSAHHPQFKRMLTGVWRHRMSDHVWMRLRKLQGEVSNPLHTMIPMEHGVEYMADSLSPEDRETDDKDCRFCRDEDGDWQKTETKSKP